jgi:hypothetical protein
VVWLRGDVDAAFERELLDVAESIPSTTEEVVVDVARMRFCDLTVAQFLDQLTHKWCVTVRFPTPRSRQFLHLTGLDRSVQIQAGAMQTTPAPREDDAGSAASADGIAWAGLAWPVTSRNNPAQISAQF